MHQLVPEFILENLRRDQQQGSFTGAALFIDISGFTSVTETLMEHGQFGAEILADMMRTIFTPLVHSVFEQGGFVTGFAGDALTAVFPPSDQEPDQTLRALAAAFRMQEHMAANARQHTRIGVFPFSAKIGLAQGQVSWGILSDEQGQRTTYYFKGSPIDESAAAEGHAAAGDIVAAPATMEIVGAYAGAEPLDGYWRINEQLAPLPRAQAVSQPAPDSEQIARFFPRRLVEQAIDGEFRQVLNVFIGLQGAPSHAQLADFMQLCFRLQEQYGGLLNRIDFGDKGCGLLLFWGAPVSYENDLTRTLDFVLALLAAGTIPLRMGITYRIAHAGYIGSPLAEEYTCYGRGVNLAARHMTSAGWGEIWLDDQVARRAGAEFRIQPLGERYFKGFAQPQPVSLLLGKRERAPILTERPFVGRGAELAYLREAIAPIFNGRFAGVVTVLGEAGIGKSRLLHALLEPLDARGEAAVFVCQTDEILRQSLNPFRSFLRAYFSQSSRLDEAANKQRFEARLADLLDRLPDPVLYQEVQRTWSFLGSLLGLRWSDSLYEQLDPELRYENTLSGLKALFKAESLRRPVVLDLEDVHWLDQDSLAFLGRLTRNISAYPIAILTTSREALPPGTFDSAAPLHTLEIRALDEEVVSRLAENILGRVPSPALLRVLVERAEGNPFFVEQVLLYLQENDLLESIEAPAAHPAETTLYIPTDVRAVLTARLDRLPGQVKDVVQKAAVLGREFETAILARMIDGDLPLEPSLATGTAESVWYTHDQVHYLFRHALLRDAAYDMQVGARRRRLHALAAAAFETEHAALPERPLRHAAIAYHYDRAEIADKAQRYYGVAGERAQSDYRNEDAISYYTRAIELTSQSDIASKVKFLYGRETIFQWLGRREQQRQDLTLLNDLLAQHPDNRQLSDLALRQSSFAVVTGDYTAALSKAEQALTYAHEAQDTLAEARAHHRQGRALWQQGEALRAEQVLDNALRLARSVHDRSLEAECLSDLVNVHRLLADYPKAQRFLEQATIIYESIEDEQGQVRCFNLFGVIDYDLGRYAESEQYYLRALALCRQIGWRYAETYVLLNLGNTQFDLGDYARSRGYLEQAAALARESGDARSQANSLDTLGLVAHYSGRAAEAISLYDEAHDILRSIDNRREMGFVLTHRGYARLEVGDIAEAYEDLQSALDLRRELGNEALMVDTLAGLAALYLARDELEAARTQTGVILAHIEDHGTEGIELPILVYLTCYRVLSAFAATDDTARTEAGRALEQGYMLLANRVRRLHDEEMRARYLEDVPYNRTMRDLWFAAQS
jgi:predicted ATPase/class 3 adenylate cyclase